MRGGGGEGGDEGKWSAYHLLYTGIYYLKTRTKIIGEKGNSRVHAHSYLERETGSSFERYTAL